MELEMDYWTEKMVGLEGRGWCVYVWVWGVCVCVFVGGFNEPFLTK
jgi:hypothetical protein